MEELRKEMGWSLLADGQRKDIIVVAHNQLDYLQNCVESIFKNTEDFVLRIWDNGSDEPTARYIRSLEETRVVVRRSDSNLGFILPNNAMAKESESDWIILLNSDTEVLKNWDKVLIGTLMANPSLAQSGFMGGVVDERMVGVSCRSGEDVDYICGYCFCISKNTHQKFGLFDEKNLDFAYFEDSDLSFRLRESGLGIYACHSESMVRHFGSQTIKEVLKKDSSPLNCALKNQQYMEGRWKSFFSGKARNGERALSFAGGEKTL